MQLWVSYLTKTSVSPFLERGTIIGPNSYYCGIKCVDLWKPWRSCCHIVCPQKQLVVFLYGRGIGV